MREALFSCGRDVVDRLFRLPQVLDIPIYRFARGLASLVNKFDWCVYDGDNGEDARPGAEEFNSRACGQNIKDESYARPQQPVRPNGREVSALRGLRVGIILGPGRGFHRSSLAFGVLGRHLGLMSAAARGCQFSLIGAEHGKAQRKWEGCELGAIGDAGSVAHDGDVPDRSIVPEVESVGVAVRVPLDVMDDRCVKGFERDVSANARVVHAELERGGQAEWIGDGEDRREAGELAENAAAGAGGVAVVGLVHSLGTPGRGECCVPRAFVCLLQIPPPDGVHVPPHGAMGCLGVLGSGGQRFVDDFDDGACAGERPVDAGRGANRQRVNEQGKSQPEPDRRESRAAFVRARCMRVRRALVFRKTFPLFHTRRHEVNLNLYPGGAR